MGIVYIVFIFGLGFGLLAHGMAKSSSAYRSLYGEINKIEIAQEYLKIEKLIEKTEDIGEKKLLYKKIRRLHSYYEIDPDIAKLNAIAMITGKTLLRGKNY